MKLPTEPIGSIPRPEYLVDALEAFTNFQISERELARLTNEALRDTIHRLKTQAHLSLQMANKQSPALLPILSIIFPT